MPKKLIREKVAEDIKNSKRKENEIEIISDQNELNGLYELKIQEEINEIKNSEYKDIYEFVDLIHVAFCFAEQNGFSIEELQNALNKKGTEKGFFSNVVLNNLNPENKSNKIYFDNEKVLKT
jgi:predicted house-cleaning noncanonical NTP pyrophosphatase (MazG superfamily)